MRSVGITRIFLANELIDPVGLQWIGAELGRDPGFDFYCYVDSVRGVELMDATLAGAPPSCSPSGNRSQSTSPHTSTVGESSCMAADRPGR